MTQRVHIEWQSSVAERYDTDMNDRVEVLIGTVEQAKVYDRYGGSGGEWADNGFTVDGLSLDEATALAQRIANEVKHEVDVIDGEGPGYTVLAVLKPA